MSGVFRASTVSDQKRLVRGEHWLTIRRLLRARDGVHQKKWRFLILAGGAPAGEITAIRELCPKSVVIAVDRDLDCLAAAIDAGADDVVHCDLADWSYRDGINRTRLPAASILKLGKFDAVNLDFCGGVTQLTRDVVSTYQRIITTHGVMNVTFSYGRDVVEMFHEELARWEHLSTRDGGEARARRLERLRATGATESVLGRLLYLLPPSRQDDIVAVSLYRGAQMPMCSVLLRASYGAREISFYQAEPGDFEIAVVYPDAAKLYDCPQERIDSLRRQFAAAKAVAARKASERNSLTLLGQI